MRVGYARVDTKDQDFSLQENALKEAGSERIFKEITSGLRTARPVLRDLRLHLREGDVLVIWKLDAEPGCGNFVNPGHWSLSLDLVADAIICTKYAIGLCNIAEERCPTQTNPPGPHFA